MAKNARKTSSRNRKRSTISNRLRIFVDYENAPDCVEVIESYDHEQVWIFVGRQQKKIPLELVQRMQALGSGVHWVSPGAVGKNALDFILAMQLGAHHATAPENVDFAIFSADKGYDPLIGELAREGRTVLRIDPSGRAAPAKKRKTKTRRKKKSAATTTTTRSSSSRSDDDDGVRKQKKRRSRAKSVVGDLTDLVAERLERMSDARRPTKRKGLLKHVESQLPASDKSHAEAVVDALRRKKVVRISRAGVVSYDD